MTMPNAVLPDASPVLIEALDRIGGDPRLVVELGTPDRAELVRRVAGHPVVLDNEFVFDDALLGACPDLRTIVFLGTGASSYIDLDACARRGIGVRNITRYGARTVAEHCFALMFAAYRDIAAQHLAIRAGGWEGAPVGELKDKVLGLIGLGEIGGEVAAIGRALGMDVIAWSRTPRPETGVRFLELDEVLRRADVVSLHLALTPQTEGVLDARRLRLIKRGAVLINTARGALLDEAALVDLLAGGHLAAAGLDVYAQEPLAPDHPLRSAPRTVLSAHTGWQSPEAIERLLRRALAIMHEELARLI